MSQSTRTTRIAAPSYQPSEHDLAALVERHGLGHLASWHRLPGGIVNPVLLLELAGGPKSAAVLRINVRNPEIPKVTKEAWVLRFVDCHLPATHSWRVPRVLGIDEQRDLIPFDYMLLDVLPGQMAWQVWKDCTPAECDALGHRMGAILAELHALPLPGERYGPWDAARHELGTHSEWRALVTAETDHVVKRVRDLGLEEPVRLAIASAWLTQHADAVPARPPRVLTHTDFHAANVLAVHDESGRRVTGVLDFEWCTAAPPAAEFAPIMSWLDVPPPAAFLDAYLRASGRARLDDAFLREAHYYEMQHHLGMLCVCHTHWGGDGAEDHTRRIDELLRGIPANGFADAGYAWPF
jgi:aminoglycoside phosphotransferase (APT) family kinase protein